MKSLSDMLKDKQGRFRQKYVMKRLVDTELAQNIKSAKGMVERGPL